MSWRVLSLSAVVAICAAGCATTRRGVVENLPRPILNTKVERPREITRRVQRPRPWEMDSTRQRASADWTPRRGISGRWKYIVVHHSASAGGNASRFDAYHRNVNHWDELGYHFVIGNGTASGDGQIEVGPRWLKQKHGAHCKTPDNQYNDHGIGICLVGDFRSRQPSPAQMASLTRLTRFLMQECDIRASDVVTHGGVTGKTVCPGQKFPLHSLRRSITAYSRASVLP